MKELQNFKLTDRLGTGIKPALAYLEKTLQVLQFVDFGDIPIASFLDQNLAMDEYGNCTITVNTLEQEAEIKGTGPQSVYLRNHNGVLEYSNNHTNWFAVGSGGGPGGGGDMNKSTYDPNEDGRVSAADELTDGLHTVTAAEAEQHLEDTAIHFAQNAIDHVNLQNIGTRTHAELEADITALQSGGGGEAFTGVVPNLEITPILSDDPTPTPANSGLMLFARLFPDGQRALPKKGRGGRPIPQNPVFFVAINGQEKQVCTLDYDAVALKDFLNARYLPTIAMKTDDYVVRRDEMVGGELVYNHPTTTVLKAEKLRVMDTGEEISSLEVADHLKGRVLARLPMDGADNIAADLNTSGLFVRDNNGVTELWSRLQVSGAHVDKLLASQAVVGIPVTTLANEPAMAGNDAIVYCWAITAGDPPVTTYELRILFPDGTRRKITTEAIV